MNLHFHIPEGKEPLPGLRTGNDLLQWITTVDHKLIGIMYMLSSVVFFIIGFLEALLIRIQLMRPENAFISPDTYNQIFSMHGTTMVFLVLTPMLFGFAMYFIPLMIGANEMAFPRLNAFSFWVFLFGGLLLYFSVFAGGAPNVGWFSYAPLSEKNFSYTPGVDYWALSLLLMGIGTVWSALNIIVTTLFYRTKGLRMNMLPLFVWMSFVNAFLVLVAFPVLNGGLVMILFDRILNAHFFTAATGGSARILDIWSSGSLYSGVAGFWDHLRGHPGIFAKTHIRI